MVKQDPRLCATLAAIDAHHAQDPVVVQDESGVASPRESIYAERMTATLLAIAPEAGATLQIAVRGQHLRRWEATRDQFPAGRSGYLEWRSERARSAADLVTSIMTDHGYDAGECTRAAAMIKKHGLRRDPDTQLLEDVACLVFLTHDFADFAAKHSDEKVIDIVTKTWQKMSEKARSRAGELTLAPRCAQLVARALAQV